MGRWFLLLCLTATGCASAPPRAGRPINPVPLERLNLRLTPGPIILAGGAVWVTCLVPEGIPQGTLRIALEGVFASELPIDRVQNRRLTERLPCGVYVASCTTVTQKGTDRVTQDLQVVGECHE